MAERVFVTGNGCISAIGNNVVETEKNLALQKTGIRQAVFINSVFKNKIPVGEVRLTNEELRQQLFPKTKTTITRTALLGLTAAKEAYEQANFQQDTTSKTALISSTSVGGMDRGEIFYESFFVNDEKGRLRDIIHHDCGDSTEVIADYLHISDYVTTISTACSSSANAIMLAARLIQHGKIDRAIVGGTDALTKFTINGFKSLNILSDEYCKPFDNSRSGLNLGEGAGYLALESETSLKKSKNKPLAEIVGFANTCEAYHQTASSPEGLGAYQAMKNALVSAQLSIDKISYINVHGTGTLNNDLSEGKAIERLFGHDTPLFSSTKAYTGHTLGACGGIEAVISILSLQSGTLYPNLNFEHKMNELEIMPITQKVQKEKMDYVLSNSFGFGGNNSSLIFKKC